MHAKILQISCTVFPSSASINVTPIKYEIFPTTTVVLFWFVIELLLLVIVAMFFKAIIEILQCLVFFVKAILKF